MDTNTPTILLTEDTPNQLSSFCGSVIDDVDIFILVRLPKAKSRASLSASPSAPQVHQRPSIRTYISSTCQVEWSLRGGSDNRISAVELISSVGLAQACLMKSTRRI